MAATAPAAMVRGGQVWVKAGSVRLRGLRIGGAELIRAGEARAAIYRWFDRSWPAAWLWL